MGGYRQGASIFSDHSADKLVFTPGMAHHMTVIHALLMNDLA